LDDSAYLVCGEGLDGLFDDFAAFDLGIGVVVDELLLDGPV
jgi:hypothetical protein